MPYRRQIISTNHFYHVFNRSNNYEHVFYHKKELERAIDLIKFYRFPSGYSFSHIRRLEPLIRDIQLKSLFSTSPIVEIHSFALMPNHFHFVLKQLVDEGVKTFLSNFQNSYAKYYTVKHKVHGPIFSNRFKAVHIETEPQLFHVIRYVELNPITAFLIMPEDLKAYPYTSFVSRFTQNLFPYVSNYIITENFKNMKRYEKFVYKQVDYQRNLKGIKDLMLD